MLLLNKTLLKLAKGLWGWIILIVLVRLAVLIFSSEFATLISAYLGNLYTLSFDYNQMIEALKSALILCLFLFLAQLLQGELEYRVAAKTRISLRKTLFSKVMELDVGHIETIGPVSAITSCLDAVETIHVYYSTYLPSLIFSVIAPIYLYFKIAPINKTVAILLIIVSESILPLNNIFRKNIEKLRKKYWTSLDDMTGYYMDSLRGLTTLKLFEKDKESEQVLSEKADILNKNINAFMKVNFTSFLITLAIIYGAIIIGIYITLKENNVTNALTLLLLSYSYFSAIRLLMNATHNALTAVSAAGKIEDILAIDTTRAYNPNLPGNDSVEKGIYVNHVSFGYSGRNIALKDICLSIPQGQVVALCGLSGCGKSTLASLLMRFFDPLNGSIYIDGKDYISLTPQQLHQRIIMVPQSVSIFNGTLKENLLIANEKATDQQLYDVLKQVKLDDFVFNNPDKLELNVGENGSKLSGGQKQKIGIARALLSHADYIIFDEATSAVDPSSEADIWQCINQLAHVRTLIIISHRLSTIKMADQIFVLENGIIKEHGTHDDLMQINGLYHQLVTQQNIMEGEKNEK